MEKLIAELHYKLDDIAQAVQEAWQYLRSYNIIALKGEMGAGKTTFVHALCEHLMVPDAVSSPTFALVNEYHFEEGFKDRIIYHMDWYRLRDAEEAINAGMEDTVQVAIKSDNYCFIEWAEKASALLPVAYATVSISLINEQERKIVLTGYGT